MAATEPWRNPRPAPNVDEVRQRVPPGTMLLSALRAWWPALVWACLIFTMSTDSFSSDHTSRFIEPAIRWLMPWLNGDQLYLIHHIIRKCAHFVEYFIFFVLVFRGVRGARRGWQWSWALLAWFIAAAYSATDEFHQVFVPSRGASAWDSLLDSTAALVALGLLFVLYRLSVRPQSAEKRV
jgi:VanZ family protein